MRPKISDRLIWEIWYAMTAQEIPTMVVSRLAAMVGKETEKIRLEVPARKFPNAALRNSSQLMLALPRRSMFKVQRSRSRPPCPRRS